MWEKVFLKKVAVLFMASIVFGVSLSANSLTGPGSTMEENKVDLPTDSAVVKNKFFIVDNVKQTGNNSKFDIWVSGPAFAVLEIFDKNGQRKGWKSISGKNKSTDIIGDIGDKWGDFYKDARDGTLIGQQSNTISEKTTMNVDIPEGGSFKISKSGTLATSINIANLGLELMGKIPLLDSLFGDSIADGIATELATAILTKPTLLYGFSQANNSEVGIKKLYTELVSVGIGVLKASSIAASNNLVAEKLENASKKLIKNGIGSFVKGAEFLAFIAKASTVERDLSYYNKYKKQFDIQGDSSSQQNESTKVILTKVKVDDKDKMIYLSGAEEKEPELISYTITNPESQIDSNKEKLEQLKAKEEELKSKINDANSTDQNIREKEVELANIESQISQLGAKLKQLEKGTDEYSYVLKDWASFARQKKSILNEINELTRQLESQRNQINRFQFESNLIMKSLKDTTDYNDDAKINLTQNAHQITVVTPFSVVYNDWYGYMTSNVRIKGTAGELRYWGGNFDDDLNDHPGGFTLETYSKTGNVENVQINDGPSYDISYNEIQKSDYNPNPKNVRIWKVDSNGNNIVVEAIGAYNYTSWGTWQQDGGIYTDYNLGHGIEHNVEGHWVAGDVTVDLPKTGSATYNGTVAGSWYTTGDLGDNANRPQYGGAIKGTMAMTVDFSNAAIVAGNLNLKKADDSSFVTATMNNMQMNTTNNAFQGKLIGANIMDNGQSGNVVKGRFYGPKAEEVGGNWNVNKTTGEFASGVFAGKK